MQNYGNNAEMAKKKNHVINILLQQAIINVTVI